VSSLRLKSFSVKDYRSIVSTERITLSDLTVLVGPNNEGKSNILQALVTGMQYLSQRRQTQTGVGRRRPEARFEGRYIWDRDFPVSKQEKGGNQRSSFEYIFEMTRDETADLAATVGHNINRDLPVTLTFGKLGQPSFSVPKQRVGPEMSAKRDEIASFLREHIHVQYIPAVRAADQARDVVADMVRLELQALTANDSYQQALQQLADLQKPVIAAMEANLVATLQEVLPDVRNVALTLEDSLRTRPVVTLSVNDGDWTDVALKGDGIQSLAALALLRHYASVSIGAQDLVLAVEEPEAHLHPQAIHSLRDVLQEIAKSQQVLVTTHSPLLVNRASITSNVLVYRNRARPAKSVAELRDALGVHAADNLTSADVVLVVEGEKDEAILTSLLCDRSSQIGQAIESGAFVIQAVMGAGNLSYALPGILQSLCRVHAFLDNDVAGKEAAHKAQEYGLLGVSDTTYASMTGKSETELEDLITVGTYSQAVCDAFNVDCTRPLGKAKDARWARRMRLHFEAQGQEWSLVVEMRVKSLVAQAVRISPQGAVRQECQGVIDALVGALEGKLGAA
jgi:putative ATP-dependent endonuclease of OLD family